MKKSLFVLLLCSGCVRATSGELQCFKAPPSRSAQIQKKTNAMEVRAIFMVKRLFDAIIDGKEISRQDEEYYFGINGGILGESIRLSLHDRGFKETKSSPLAVLLSHKLYKALNDKKRFSFAFSSEIHTIDRENIPRAGVSASHILFVRAIPLTEDQYFNDIGNGVNFIFAINYTSDKKDSVYIDLIYSYINGIPFYKFLGFHGNFASGLKLSDGEIETIFCEDANFVGMTKAQVAEKLERGPKCKDGTFRVLYPLSGASPHTLVHHFHKNKKSLLSSGDAMKASLWQVYFHVDGGRWHSYVLFFKDGIVVKQENRRLPYWTMAEP